jgi:hypothetical protein
MSGKWGRSSLTLGHDLPVRLTDERKAIDDTGDLEQPLDLLGTGPYLEIGLATVVASFRFRDE